MALTLGGLMFFLVVRLVPTENLLAFVAIAPLVQIALSALAALAGYFWLRQSRFATRVFVFSIAVVLINVVYFFISRVPFITSDERRRRSPAVERKPTLLVCLRRRAMFISGRVTPGILGLIPGRRDPVLSMSDQNQSEFADRPQYSLGSVFWACVVIGSAIIVFVLNYNTIWGSVNEPDKYPKTFVILERYRQFWFCAAVAALAASFVVPRNYRKCLLILCAIALAAGLYNFLLPLGAL